MKKKEKSGSIKKYVYSTCFVLLILAEIFVAINYSEQFLWIIGIGVCILVDNYLLINTLAKEVREEKEKQTKQLQNIDRSKKALYILFKKNFTDLDKRMSAVEKLVIPISNELETSQRRMEDAIVQSMEDNRKVAKLIIGRNKENAEALMNYNGEFAEKLRLFEEKLEQIETKVSNMVEGAVVEKQDDVTQEAAVKNMTVEEEAETEEKGMDMSDPNKPMSPEDIEALLASIASGESEEPEDEELGFEAMEETAVPDFSDPNKIMSPEDIAALIANM